MSEGAPPAPQSSRAATEQPPARAPRVTSLRAVALLLVLCTLPARAEPDAGVRLVVDVERAELVTPDGGVLHVRGGCYLDDSACLETARELASLRAEVATLRGNPIVAGLPAVVVSFVAGLLVAGLLVGLWAWPP